MADLAITKVTKARVKSILPAWFKPETGFRFAYGNDEAVVLGFGGYRKHDIGGSVVVAPSGKPVETYFIDKLEMCSATLVIGYFYKGEWFISDVESIIHEAERNREPFPFKPVEHLESLTIFPFRMEES